MNPDAFPRDGRPVYIADPYEFPRYEEFPKYREYLHMKNTGVWPECWPSWGRDANGRPCDVQVKNAVIEELSQALGLPQPEFL